MLQGGGKFSCVQLSGDGATLFACCVDSVLAFSTTTGEQIYALQHAGRLSALALSTTDSSQLYTACLDGCVTLWDLPTGTRAQQWLLDSPVESLVVGDSAYVSCHWRQQQAGRLFAYDLSKGAASSGRAKVSTAHQLVASPASQLLATVDRHTAMVWRADRFPHTPLVLTHTKTLTCAALSTSGDVLAVGDATGRIVFWHGIREAVEAAEGCAEPALPQATVHWHAEPVCCLQFSPDDTYLLSGGHEGVLVVWDMSSGRRAYLPRLGSCLQSIASCPGDPSRFAVTLSDNVIRMVDLASMQVQCSIRGICSSPAGCTALHPVTGHLALASAAATLQFFDPHRNAHVDRLQLSDLSAYRAAGHANTAASKLPAPTHAVFSASAEVLITVEQRTGVTGGAVSLVKAWRSSQVAAYGHSYVLAAGAGNPWSIEDSVKAVAIHPDRPLVAVALGSGGVSCWQLEAGFSGQAWTAAHMQDLQGCMVDALAFSPDGSVLAVASTTHTPVLLVDPETRAVLAALPPLLDFTQHACTVRCLDFLADGIHLAAQWDGGAAVFDLIRSTTQWAAQLPTTLLAVDAHAPRVAIGTPSGAIVQLGATGTAGEAAGLLHGRQAQSAFFLQPEAQVQGGDGTLVVLSDAQQYAAVGGGTPAPVARRDGRQSSGPPAEEGAAAKDPLVSSVARKWLRQGGDRVALDCQQSASHLLAAATELCPLALERLLL